MKRFRWIGTALLFLGVAQADPGFHYQEYIIHVSECRAYVVQAPSGSFKGFEVTKCLIPNWFQERLGSEAHHESNPEYFGDESECERVRAIRISQMSEMDPCPPDH